MSVRSIVWHILPTLDTIPCHQNAANDMCHVHCNCPICFTDTIIHPTLKFVAFNWKDQPNINGNDELKEGVISPTPVLFTSSRLC
jgi:hypothetical protein